jgi:hypothetical protein
MGDYILDIRLRTGTGVFDLLKLQRISSPHMQVLSSEDEIYHVCMFPVFVMSPRSLLSSLSYLRQNEVVCITDVVWRSNRRLVTCTRDVQLAEQSTVSPRQRVLLAHGAAECRLIVTVKTWDTRTKEMTSK